jgi:ubiquinone/menaquinone biosynthesis C-methylase UbiE
MDASQIFDEWGTYQKVVAGDYMHHRDFFAALVDEVETRLAQPLAIIDIGCGDVQPVLDLLKHFQIERYVGIDQSQAALELAHKSLKPLNISYDLRCETMLDEMSRLDGDYDLAIASYSLHHLDGREKQAALSECRRLLRADALLAVIDVFLEEGESRSAYFGRWMENARQTFTSLAADELEALLAHVHSCDIPESASTYCKFGMDAGFESVTPIREDRERLNKLVVLS